MPASRSRGASAWCICCRACVASLAAIIYVAHLGQARSDAGNGYELDAITAVVLGGTSVFGGRGTICGTVLGLLALSVLQNGLQLAALPSELTGVLTGALLVVDDRHRSLAARETVASGRPRRTRPVAERQRGESREKQSGCCAVRRDPRRSLIVAGHQRVAGAIPRLGSASRVGAAAARRRPVIAMMPKAKGDPYFVSCRTGAEEAARELGVELIWDGPTGPRRRPAERAGRELDHAEAWM